MIAAAVGQLGLSLAETYDLTLDEFGEIYQAWAEFREMEYRDQWERTRFLAHCILMPYSKKKLKPQDLLRFPWEQPARPEKTTKADLERIKRRYGD